MKKHNIELLNDELLVLHELLIRVGKKKLLDKHFIDQSEQVVLWNLECLCEKNNENAFKRDYINDVKKARDNLRHNDT